MTITELVKELTNLKITQTQMDWEESMEMEDWERLIKGKLTLVETGLDVDAHRWYEKSTSVYRYFEPNGDIRLLGVSHVSNLFSESMDVEDCYAGMEFFEMVEVPSVTYKKR